MDGVIERWLSGPLWRRVASLVAVIGVVMLAAWQVLIEPPFSQLPQLAASGEQAERQVAEWRRKIRAIPRYPLPVQPSAPQVFSVAEFVRQSNGQLLKWQPGDKQGTLQMVVPWEALPGLFARLGAYRVVSDLSFTITARRERLNLLLTLEFADEP